MKNHYSRSIRDLTVLSGKEDPQSNALRINILQDMRHSQTMPLQAIPAYVSALIYQLACPSSPELRLLAEEELTRLTQRLKKSVKASPAWSNTGLPYTSIQCKLSHRMLRWLLHDEVEFELTGLKESRSDLLHILRVTLPDLERGLAEQAGNNGQIREQLKLKPKQFQSFLLSEFQKLDHMPLLKDQLFQQLGLQCKLSLSDPALSLPFNRVPVDSVHYARSASVPVLALREAICEPVPAPEFLSIDMRNSIPRVCRMQLLYDGIELDAVTYLDTESLHYYTFENGFTVAVFAATHDRQLPLESLLGFALFQNGIPACIGEARAFGRKVRVFPHFSGWFRQALSLRCGFANVLRTLHGVLGVWQLEITSHSVDEVQQLLSMGFRPEDPSASKLNGTSKKSNSRELQVSKELLKRLLSRPLAFALHKPGGPNLEDIRSKVTAHINKNHDGNRFRAERAAVLNFLQKTGFRKPHEPEYRRVLADVAFVCEAMQWNHPDQVLHLKEMILRKPRDVYRYQEELLKVLEFSMRKA
ncbi:MAG: hypothetical protein KBF37_07460 [Saprospiraceae bacterium]|jgi:hypothetical protein|nr:hypothetical protein [Saprospiraceae bacterium]MBV6473513.1 hypothetical protein [Saprospiraceae bacterium]